MTMPDKPWNESLKAEAQALVASWNIYVDDRQALGDLLDLLGLDDIEPDIPYKPTNPCAACGKDIYLTDTVDVTILGDQQIQTHAYCTPPSSTISPPTSPAPVPP